MTGGTTKGLWQAAASGGKGRTGARVAERARCWRNYHTVVRVASGASDRNRRSAFRADRVIRTPDPQAVTELPEAPRHPRHRRSHRLN